MLSLRFNYYIKKLNPLTKITIKLLLKTHLLSASDGAPKFTSLLFLLEIKRLSSPRLKPRYVSTAID